MSEDTKAAPAAEVEDKPQLSAIQQKAVEQGWRPKEEFQGEESEFIDAPEFVRRGELFEKIEHQSRETKALRSAIEALKQHNTKIEQSSYDRAVRDLSNQRKAAMLDGDTERALAIEDQLDSAKATKARIDAEANRPAVTELNPEFTKWQDSNKWYQKDRAMTAFADNIGLELAREGKSPPEVLREVEKQVKKEFAHKFTNPATSRPNAVEGASRSGSTASSDVALSDAERQIMRKIVSTGVMTEAEYKKQLKSTR